VQRDEPESRIPKLPERVMEIVFFCVNLLLLLTEAKAQGAFSTIASGNGLKIN
jgi:hypothetical protein